MILPHKAFAPGCKGLTPAQPKGIKNREDENRMKPSKFAWFGVLLLLITTGLLGTLSGCGDSKETSEVTVTPEAKKADQGIQGGMKEFMESKNKTKGHPKG